jgi:sugar-phosphatase
MKIKVRGILFDMDGVLVSSIGSVERSWTKWALMRDVKPALAIQTAHGRRSIEAIRVLRPDLDAEIENAQIEALEIEDKEGVEALAGVSELTRKLPPGSWTVVTSATCRLSKVRMSLAGITPPARWIAADEVANGKPHPEPYLRGAELLGLPPSECLVIEDSASGAKAGHAAGCKVLATTFSHSIESLDAADWIVDSLNHVHVTVLPGNEGLELEFQPLARS